MKFIEQLFGFEREETPGEVIFFRVFELFVAVYTVKLAWDWGLYTLRISDIVLPLGIAQHVDVSFMFDHSLSLVNAGFISALVVVGFFRLSRYGYAAAFLLLHLQYAARYSLGEIPHSANMFGMTLLGLSLAMLAFSHARQRRRFTLGFAYFFIGLGYTVSAACKLVATGLSWPSGQHLWLWIGEKNVDLFAKTGVFDPNWLQQLALDHYGLATAFLVVGLLTELSAFLMWWPRFRTPVICAVIGLHIGIHLTMNILFVLSLIELILLGFPWAVWIDRALPHSTAATLVRRLTPRRAGERGIGFA